MSKIIEWLKEPMPKGEVYERYFIELKDKSTITVDKAEGHIVRDGFFIIDSKDIGSILVNLSEIKAVYTNLFVCNGNHSE